jgi:hypothetical protein
MIVLLYVLTIIQLSLQLRKYRLRVFTKCNEPEQHKHVIAFFDRNIPTLKEVELILDWIGDKGMEKEKKEELMAAVRRSEM